MFLVGLTGGIASGKSTVSKILSEEYGIPIIDADLIARKEFLCKLKVVKPNTIGWKRVKKLFGEEILNSDQTINREKLGEIIFQDASKRRQLNKSLHGLIMLEMLKQIFFEFIKGTQFVVLDVPLLFEAKIALYLVSYKVVVYCDNDEERLRRLLQRNPSLSPIEAKQRIQSQMRVKDQIEMADFLIDNSKDVEHTKKQVNGLVPIFKKSKKHYLIRACLAIFGNFLVFGLFYLVKILRS